MHDLRCKSICKPAECDLHPATVHSSENENKTHTKKTTTDVLKTVMIRAHFNLGCFLSI